MQKTFEWLQELKQLFFPVEICLICGKKTKQMGICELCVEDLQAARRCSRCGSFLSEGTGYCPFCDITTRFPFEKIISAAPYEGELRKHLHDFKYKNKTWLKRPLVELLFLALSNENLIDYAVVAVPMFAGKERQRGYNQAALLAEALAKRKKLPYLKEVLIRQCETPSLYNLKKDARASVLKDVFVVGKDGVAGKKILLVDDISTTGTTVIECTKSLLAAGATEVMVVVVATTKV